MKLRWVAVVLLLLLAACATPEAAVPATRAGLVFVSPALGQGVAAFAVKDRVVAWKREPRGDVRDGRPMHLAFDEASGRLWVGDLDGNGVVALDGATGETVFSVKLPREVVGIALSPDGRRLVAGARDALEAYVVDAVHGTLSGTVKTGPAPTDAGPAFFTAHPAFIDGGRAVLVPDNVHGALVRIDPSRLIVEDTFPTEGPVHAIDSCDERLVALAEGVPGKSPPRLLALDPRSGKPIASVEVPLDAGETPRLHHGCFSPDGKRYWVANMGPLKDPGPAAGHTVALVDVSDPGKLRLVCRAKAGAGAGHPVLSGDTLYVVNHHETFVSRFDAATLADKGALELTKARGFGHGVAIVGRTMLLLATGEKALLAVDLDTGAVTRTDVGVAPGELELGG